jgi:hypothetical protein
VPTQLWLTTSVAKPPAILGVMQHYELLDITGDRDLDPTPRPLPPSCVNCTR